GIALCSWAMLKLVILNRSGVRMLAFGALALVGGILHDLFLFLNWLPGRELLSVGVLVFLVSQIGFLTFYRTQEQLRILDQNNTLQNATQELKSRLRWRSDELKLKDEEVEQRKAETQRLLRHDGLTGLLNRHHFLELIERRLERMSPFDFSLVIVDIDHYKLIVDQHGREFAEEVLRQTANVLTKVCSGQFDRIPARYGGDEFILWLGRSSKEEAEELARHIRKMVSRIELPVGSDSVCRFSLSTGVATASAGDGISQDQLNTLLAKAADAVHHSRHLQRSNSPLSRTPKTTAGTSMVRGRV
ncbi:MAG: GGDEF domain-containing protein, partial [Oceanospirillum sp.]|nr:GGDEF domain-containing protein [Oceanospirillum sp.]